MTLDRPHRIPFRELFLPGRRDEMMVNIDAAGIVFRLCKRSAPP
jgi:hypothetical protein